MIVCWVRTDMILVMISDGCSLAFAREPEPGTTPRLVEMVPERREEVAPLRAMVSVPMGPARVAVLVSPRVAGSGRQSVGDSICMSEMRRWSRWWC